jgi:peptide methionine sulfoxide reductase MsrA
MSATTEKAVVAGGCFWGMQDLIRKRPGIISTRVGYTGDEQKRVAEDAIADVEASGLWPGKVVTEVVPEGPFWEAEPEHQDYLEHYPNGYTCHFPRPGWVLPRRSDAEGSAQMKTVEKR